MNRSKETYDRYMVGARIQQRRQSLGLSQEALAERMDRAAKYCSDIERGVCGMSIETMLAFSEQLDMSLDYMIYGKASTPEADAPEPKQTALERTDTSRLLEQCTDRQYTYAARLLELFLEATQSEQSR